MAEMGGYCKAYLAKDLRAFDGWKEDVSNLRKETQEVDGKEVEVPREAIDDEDILYLHETYVVTDDAFQDENVVFDDVTDAWKTFCHDVLEFEVPQYEPLPVPQGDEAADGDAAGA